MTPHGPPSPMWTRDTGSAMVAVILVLIVGMVVGVASLQMARHSNESTTVDRFRVQSVHAAEAGVNDAINRLEHNAACDTSATTRHDLNDAGGTISYFQTRIDPESGETCTSSLNRVIHAWGFAQANGKSTRRLEVQVRLIPQDGFRFTFFASGPTGIVFVKNTGTVDGDIYAENLNQTHNNINSDSVITPGSIDTKNGAIYQGTLWAGGDVALRQNGSVGQSIIAAGSSAPGDVLLENGTTISRDVKAAGMVTLPTTYTIDGSLSENNPNLQPPPQLDKPTFTWDPNNYPSHTEGTAATITSSLESSKNDLQGVYYATDGGTVDLPRHGTVSGHLTIVSTGKVNLGRSLDASGGPWQVVIIALSTASDAISVNHPFSASSNLDVLLYTPGGIDIKNSVTFKGALYADSIEVKNSVNVSRSESLANNPPPGFDFSQSAAARFTVVPTLWREVAPGDPPA